MSGAGPVLVILAAGASTRLGQPKALARLGETEPATPLARLLAAGADLAGPPLVVTGADHAAIAAALPEGVRVLHNEHWADGRTGGVRRAAELLPGRDLCLAPVDVPRVPADVFRTLVRAWREAGAPATGWLAPAVLQDGRRRHGHPVVVGRELLRTLGPADDARPLRELRGRAEPLLAALVDAPEVLEDLDEPGDLAALGD